MSSDDIKIVHEMIANLLNNDNTIRKEAEVQFNKMNQNKSGLIFCLMKVIMESNQKNIKNLSCLLINKILNHASLGVFSDTWEKMTDIKEMLKSDIIAAILSEEDRFIKLKLCDTLATIAENVYEAEEVWDGLSKFVFSSLELPIDENNNQILIECVLYVISKLFGVMYDEFTKQIDFLVKVFNTYIKSNNINLRVKTLQAINEILCIVKKKDSKKFKEFIYYMLETTLHCMNDVKEENNLRICVLSLCDVANTEPNIFKKHFADLFILMGKLTEKTDLEDHTIRELGFETIITMVEKNEKYFSKDHDKLQIFIEALFKYSLEMEEEITTEWANPKTDSYIDEDYAPEEQLELVLTMLDRLCDCLGSPLILQKLSVIVQQLIDNTTSWKYKYIGYMVISQMIEDIKDIKSIDTILPKIFEDMENANPKIRYACMQCIEQLSDFLHKGFQPNYHEQVVPLLINRVNDTVLRNQLQACETIQAFLEHLNYELAIKYCEALLDTLFSVFLLTNIPISMREAIIHCCSELVSVCKNDFKPYAEKCLNILLKYFTSVLIQDKLYKSLYGSILEVITLIGPKCEELYLSCIPDLTNIILQLQDNIEKCTDPLFENLKGAWEDLIPLIKIHYPNILDSIIISTIKLIEKVPNHIIKFENNKELNLDDILKEDSNQTKIIKKRQKPQISTSDTSDFAASIDLLNKIIDLVEDKFLGYIDQTIKMTLPLLRYDTNNDIRIEASNTFLALIKLIKSHQINILENTAKLFISELISVLESEGDNACIATQLDNLGGIIESVGMILSEPEINVLFQKLLEIFNKVELFRQSNIEKKHLEEKYVSDTKKNNDKINSDDEDESVDDNLLDEINEDIKEIEEVLTSISLVMGSLFKTHKSLTLNIVNELLTKFLPNYFLEQSSVFQKKMGLFILDDMIEHLGQELLPNIWTDLSNLLLEYTNHTEPCLRQAAAYGIGEFAKMTIKDYPFYNEKFFIGITNALSIKSSKEHDEEFGYSYDNKIAAIGKIIKSQHSNIDIVPWLNHYINGLPLKYDEDEAQIHHDLLIDLLINQPSLLLGNNYENLFKIILILAKIYQTELVNQESDKTIMQIVTNIKNNTSMTDSVKLAMQIATEDEVKTKLAIWFN